MAVLCLMGPTASGKSAAALRLAEHYPVEIVSVDSALVYRHMDIGTAKPSASDQRAVPHHLIDIVEPEEPYSAARFASDASRLIGEIQSRGRHALLVGGTMLYFRALQQGLDELPAADAGVRQALDARAARDGWPALHAELARVDAKTAARLAPHDAQRIQRALEVFMVSGQPISAWHGRVPAATASWHNLSLEPSDRRVLHERIANRLQTMFQRGLLDEVRALRERPGLHAGLPSMRAVGYRQAWEYLAGDIDEPTMHARALAATRQLAKHQLTWLRRWPDRQVIDCLSPDAGEQLLRAVQPRLQAP